MTYLLMFRVSVSSLLFVVQTRQLKLLCVNFVEAEKSSNRVNDKYVRHVSFREIC